MNPELIPDSLAYRLVFEAFSEPPDATPEQHLRQRIKLSRVHLSEPDLVAVFNVLADHQLQSKALHDRLDAAIESAKQNHTSLANISLDGERDELDVNTISRLRSTLSSEAMARFHAFVMNEKSRMKIIAGPEGGGQQ